MYIPWGPRTTYRPLGRVADFCPACHDFRPFRLARAERVQSFYFILYGPRTEIGTVRTCEVCGHEAKADPATYRAPVGDPEVGLDRLIAETNPEIRRNWAARLILEERVRSRKLTPGERTMLIREPFDWANEALDRRSVEGQLDRPTGYGCLLTFLAPVACLGLLPLAWNGSTDAIEIITLALGALCLAFTFIAIVTDARRYYRRAILPRLVDAIRPLNPSAEEVDEVLESLKGDRATLTSVATTREIHHRTLDPWG